MTPCCSHIGETVAGPPFARRLWPERGHSPLSHPLSDRRLGSLGFRANRCFKYHSIEKSNNFSPPPQVRDVENRAVGRGFASVISHHLAISTTRSTRAPLGGAGRDAFLRPNTTLPVISPRGAYGTPPSLWVTPLSKTNRSSRSAKLLAGCMIGAARVPMRFSAPVNRNYPGVRLLGAYGLADGISNVIAFVRVASQRALLIEGLIGLDCRHPNIRVACHYYPRFALPHRISGRSLQASLRLSRAFVFQRAHQ